MILTEKQMKRFEQILDYNETKLDNDLYDEAFIEEWNWGSDCELSETELNIE